ncbi:MAG TPA: PhzF family phenazine biosynthesis protein [Opitutaceae bacterium]|jgi:PhzF family phenazine biosynthesis protein|nr:PhzF family phenazine biosynthesis protein [Opitutaceae bacterium]
MNLPLYWLDAFTGEIFRGNPAAVVPLDAWLPDGLLQKIAFENGLSETAFFVRTGPAHFHLRWFTPAIEVDLCGHATLATAWTLFHPLGQGGEAVVFDSRSGPLTVARRGDGLLELDFPSRPAQPAVPTADLLRGLGRAPQIVGQAKTTWLCVYSSADDVTTLSPDHAALARVIPGRMIVTAPGRDGIDFVSRFFAPDAGIAEDPVTGSAHCTLVPYWAARLGKTKFHARQVSPRGGELWCELAGDRVKIAGRCALYLRGDISV